MADTTLVYTPTKNVHTTSSSCENQVSKVNGVVNYGKALKIEVISSNAAKLISMSRRPGSIAANKSAWNKWVSWCCRQQIDPVCWPLSEILNYLSTLFEKGLQYRDPICWPLSEILNYLSTLFEKVLQYRTINSHRSAISAYHKYVDGKPVGKHPRVCALLTGVFNQRSP